MAATNILTKRGRILSAGARGPLQAFRRRPGTDKRTLETFEILHFAAWTPAKDDAALTLRRKSC